ncbi:hypothetical protein Tco_0777477 [Tanacetum coccineum]
MLLTENPTIYVSLIHQFWQTASASTSENGEMEITATIDGRVKIVTEASIRRHLKLEDSYAISTLPNTEIFEQLALMRANSFRVPLITVLLKEAATMPHDSPLQRVHSLGSDEGSMTLHELTVLCTTLSKKVESLESDLKRQRIARVHEEANTFNAEEWDNIQAQIKADEELAQNLQAKERGKFSEVEKAKLLVEMINERKRLFVQQRAEQRRNKPMTQAQQRTYMCNYIKHIGSHTLQQLKRLSFDELKALVAEVELDHEGSKKQKTNEASGSVQEQPEEDNKIATRGFTTDDIGRFQWKTSMLKPLQSNTNQD